MLPTYKEQFDKITEAYIKNEIKPCDSEFCFCGTLSPNWEWKNAYAHSLFTYHYSLEEYGRMEKALFSELHNLRWMNIGYVQNIFSNKKAYTEEELFNGMCAALDVLKQIHIEHGEVIDEIPTFTKRQILI